MSGKSALRRAAEESERIRIEEEARKTSGKYVDEVDQQWASQYLIRKSKSDLHAELRNTPYVAYIGSDEVMDADSFAFFQPFIADMLILMRSDCLWKGARDSLAPEIDQLVDFLEGVADDDDINWNITRQECEQLYIIMVMYRGFFGEDAELDERIDSMISRRGGIGCTDYYEKVLRNPGAQPGEFRFREHIAWEYSRILVGGDGYGAERIHKAWVDEAVLSKAMVVLGDFLQDPRNPIAGKDMVAHGVEMLAYDSRWSRIVCDGIKEPLRQAWLRGEIDANESGDFSDKLLTFCRGIVRSEFIKSGKRQACDTMIDQDTEYMFLIAPPGQKSGSGDESEAAARAIDEEERLAVYDLYAAEFLRNPRGINACRCCHQIRRTHLHCAYDRSRRIIRELEVQLALGRSLLDKGLIDKATVVSCKAVITQKELSNQHVEGMRSACNMFRRMTVHLRAECHLAADDVHEAEALLLGLVPCYMTYAMEKKASAAAATAPPVQGEKRRSLNEGYDFKACLRYSEVLSKLGRATDCQFILETLLDSDVVTKISHFGSNKSVRAYEAIDGEEIKARAQVLLDTVKAAAAAEPPEDKSRRLGQVVSGQTAAAIKFAVEQASWGQIGNTACDDGSVRMDVQVVPRLKWALIWVKEQLLVWDFCHDRVVHWLLLDGVEEISAPRCVDLGTDKNVLYFFSCRPFDKQGSGPFSTQFIVLNLGALAPGGKTSFYDAFIALFGSLGKAPLANLLNVWSCSCIEIEKSDDGTYRTAVGQTVSFESDGSIKANSVVAIYSGICGSSALGPLCFEGRQPCIVLLHTSNVIAMSFVPDSPYFVTSCCRGGNASIAIWDAFSENRNGTMPVGRIAHGLRGVVWGPKLTCASNLIFLAHENKWGSRRDRASATAVPEPYDPAVISVWRVPDGQRVASLVAGKYKEPTRGPTQQPQFAHHPDCSNPGWVERDECVSYQGVQMVHACGDRLMSAHSDGSVNVWSFTGPPGGERFLHRQCHRVLADSIKGMSLSTVVLPRLLTASPSVALLVASTDRLVVLRLDEPSSGMTDSPHPSPAPLAGVVKASADIRNCGHCLLWAHDIALLRCSACGVVRYCGPRCQKAAWTQHKLQCKKLSKGTS